MVAAAALGSALNSGVGAQAVSGAVTFTKDIAPILQRSCEKCHRTDGVAPMSFATYEEVRPWARAIKQRTGLGPKAGVMPPWYVEKNIGIQEFQNDPSLSDEEVAKIAKWADSGAPRGQPRRHAASKDLPGRQGVDDRHAGPHREAAGHHREGQCAGLVGRDCVNGNRPDRGPLRRGARNQGSQRRRDQRQRPADGRRALRLPSHDLGHPRGDAGSDSMRRRAARWRHTRVARA